VRGDDGVFVFSIAHVGVCQGVCPLFFEFYEEIQKLFTRAFPPRTPRHPKLKFGEVVEVIILLYYFRVSPKKGKPACLSPACLSPACLSPACLSGHAEVVHALIVQNYFWTCGGGRPTTKKRTIKHGVWQHHTCEGTNINQFYAC